MLYSICSMVMLALAHAQPAKIQLGSAAISSTCDSEAYVKSVVAPAGGFTYSAGGTVKAYLGGVPTTCADSDAATPCTDITGPMLFTCTWTAGSVTSESKKTKATMAMETLSGVYTLPMSWSASMGAVLGISTYVECPMPTVDQVSAGSLSLTVSYYGSGSKVAIGVAQSVAVNHEPPSMPPPSLPPYPPPVSPVPLPPPSPSPPPPSPVFSTISHSGYGSSYYSSYCGSAPSSGGGSNCMGRATDYSQAIYSYTMPAGSYNLAVRYGSWSWSDKTYIKWDGCASTASHLKQSSGGSSSCSASACDSESYKTVNYRFTLTTGGTHKLHIGSANDGNYYTMPWCTITITLL